MKRKRMFRLTAVFLAMVMCVTAFSVTALASGGEDTAEVTGGMEPDSSESAAAESDTEETGDMEEPAADEGAGSGTEAVDGDILEQITALLDRADELSEKTAELKERIAALRQARICPACGAACGRDDQFCRRCGGSL